MIQNVMNAATSIFLPYFAPVIFILLVIVIADRLRELMTNAVQVKGGGRRTS